MSGARQGTVAVDALRLASGETLPKTRLHYRTMGSALRDASGKIVNAALLLHGTTGSSDQFLRADFAEAMFGAGQPLDTRRWFVVMPDALGHGGSSKPSDGLHGRFPTYGYRDMVAAQRILCDRLGIDRLPLVLGTSMGAMHTWLWAGLYPDRIGSAVAVAGGPAPVKGRNLLWRTMIARAVRGDPGWDSGQLSPTSLGFWASWPVCHLMYSTPCRLEHVADAAQAIMQLEEWVSSAPDPYDMVYALEASRDYDPQPLLERIRTPLLWINFHDDEVNPPELRATIGGTRVLRFDVPAGPDSYGHQTLAHAEVYADRIAAFIADALPNSVETWGRRLKEDPGRADL